ncbi:methyltransferase [Agarivorans sp. B2Z047]|uniref:class I SAM-dependent methyltransferase n=1 Tax=Agarivorans sp. B2Z047 TaxID=2652721 RepID=UPI00128CF597|nr:class I SAM-dependent methyltransferase [Agarivorans sp. B2Z047]MPW28738.1 methyltransferase [Agarivorans sp. B2Z047]UQN41299.1 class I SAM-dependent methyltransferase [Agarivorans sp. B2Z047]
MKSFKLDSNTEALFEEMVGPPGVWNESSKFQLDFFTQIVGITPQSTFLDIGCGVLRGGVRMVDYLEAGKYTGVDIRPKAIEMGRELITRFSLDQKKPNLVVSGDFGECLLGKFDFIWAFQLSYHLTDELVKDLFTAISRRLEENGSCFMNINTLFGDNNSKAWKGFPFYKKERQFYIDLADEVGLKTEYLGQLKDFGYTNKVKGQYNEMLRFSR